MILIFIQETIQKRSFTKWINSFLKKFDLSVVDLFTELRDGRHLLALLESISGTAMPKPSRGTLKLHSVENVGKALAFLKAAKV